MVKKKSEVVYQGYIEPSLTEKILTSQKQTPTYEDSGVRYQGYYKKRIGSDEYKTNPQNKIIIHQTKTGSTFSSIYDIPNGKKLLLCSAVISSLYSGGGVDALYFTDGDSGTIPPQRIFLYYRFNSNQIKNIIFEPIVELTTALWVGQLNADSDITFYGFLEDL